MQARRLVLLVHPWLMATLFSGPLVLGPRLATAQDQGEPAAAEPQAAEQPEPAEAPDSVVTEHSVTIGGQTIPYTATAGTMSLAEEDGTVKANIFFIAYARSDVEDLSGRPITFAFNGGPGSSSVWLHLGAFGPRRVEMTEEGWPLAPPYRLVENPFSLLDVTDLVFIDPVTTGYSRAVPGEDPSQFYGVNQDIESVGHFIRLFTTRFKRWESPKFLAGESYGTTRAAGLAGHLQDRHGMFLNGIVLISAILHFQTARFDRGNDLPYILFLPTYTATAWYHGRLDDDLQVDLRRTLDEVERFASGEYAQALMQGDALDAATEARIAQTLARYTGLSPRFVGEARRRISMSRFAKELLRDRGQTIGRLDSRFTGTDFDDAGASAEYDPSYAAIQGPYTATLNHYLRVELTYESDLPYEILTGRVRPWSYGRATNRYLNVAETLRAAMTKNRHLRVFIANGYYDLATPYFATNHTVRHLGLDPSLRDHVTMSYYEAGHMMYIRQPSLEKLKVDLVEFYGSATGH